MGRSLRLVVPDANGVAAGNLEPVERGLDGAVRDGGDPLHQLPQSSVMSAMVILLRGFSRRRRLSDSSSARLVSWLDMGPPGGCFCSYTPAGSERARREGRAPAAQSSWTDALTHWVWLTPAPEKSPMSICVSR